jgi:hypothetical protein
VIFDFLYETFGPRVIYHYPGCHNCGQVWPPHSPDINPCNIFLWGFMSDKHYSRKPGSLMELTATIIQLCCTISEDLCSKVVTNVQVRLEEVMRQNRRHAERVH